MAAAEYPNKKKNAADALAQCVQSFHICPFDKIVCEQAKFKCHYIMYKKSEHPRKTVWHITNRAELGCETGHWRSAAAKPNKIQHMGDTESHDRCG